MYHFDPYNVLLAIATDELQIAIATNELLLHPGNKIHYNTQVQYEAKRDFSGCCHQS